MGWFNEIHEGQPAQKQPRRAAENEKPDAEKMMELMTKLRLKNSLEIRGCRVANLPCPP